MRTTRLVLGAATLAVVLLAAPAAWAPRVGHVPRPFPQGAENEPALAVDASRDRFVVLGADEYRDQPACQRGPCRFDQRIGISGAFFSNDGGQSFVPADYDGNTTRDAGLHGRIETLPHFDEAGLASRGDPSLAFGPRLGPRGFHWVNGSTLYYAGLATAIARRASGLDGAQGVTVSRSSDVAEALDGGKMPTWDAPTIVSNRPGEPEHETDDKPSVWADNAASSRHFGSVYACWTVFDNATSAHRPLHFDRPRGSDNPIYL